MGIWNESKSIRQNIKKIHDEIYELEKKSEKLTYSWEYAKVAEIQYGKLPEKKKKLEELEKKWLQNDIVWADDVASIVAKWTGVPVWKLVVSEADIYTHLEDELRKHVIGQETALAKVAQALRRSKAWLSDEGRPIGSFLFLGPTGVGKTETAKALCRILWNNPNAYIRLDMSEYMESHSVSRLIGAPPGYIGHDEGGQLTEAVRRHPYSVILLDEVEKAHPDVWNVFLQILDEGSVTDSKWRKIDMKNTIIIMTSNIWSYLLNENGEIDFEKRLRDELKKYFRIEFLNRIDDIIVYHPLSTESIEKIVVLLLEDVKNRLKQKNITLQWDQNLVKKIALLGYDRELGARPLRRAITEYIVNPLSENILKWEILEWDTLDISLWESTILGIKKVS